MPKTLILGSGSLYRRLLLERLRLPFEVHSPDIDETPAPGEKPRDLAMRLARGKAEVIAQRFPQALVIGSDQVIECGDRILDKPGTVERCIDHLKQASGRTVIAWTAVCVIDESNQLREEYLDVTKVKFRPLEEAEIRRYVETEKPLNCGGGLQVEGLGITLLESVETKDPTALIGLPLIWVAAALRRAGLLL